MISLFISFASSVKQRLPRLASQKALFISFACPKETNQRKGQPQIFFGSNIFSAAHAIQLALRLTANCIYLLEFNIIFSLIWNCAKL